MERPKSLEEIMNNAFPHEPESEPVSEETDEIGLAFGDGNESAPPDRFDIPFNRSEVKTDDSLFQTLESEDHFNAAPEPESDRQAGRHFEQGKAKPRRARKKDPVQGGNAFVRFIKGHKVITAVVAVIVFLVLAAVLTVNYYLSKINYVKQEDYIPQQQQEKQNIPKYITLSTGEMIDVRDLERNADGSYTLPDGRRFNLDRTIWNLDGSMVFYDGSYMLADGTAVLADGTTFYPNETLVFQSGKFYEKTRISVDSEGYVKFYNGVIAHITNFMCSEDGTCTAKDSALSDLKYNVSGSWNAFDKDKSNVQKAVINEEDIEDSEEAKALANAEGLNDDDVASNYNNNEIWYSDDIKNILLMGIDNGSKRYPYGRSDSMILISLNTKTKGVKMLSFSRAVYAAVAGYENTRLSHAHGYGGAPLAIDAIERNYKIRIDNYVETGFSTFEQIIDVLDGVTLDISSSEAKALKSKIIAAGIPYVGAGTYLLNGKLALEYARLRSIDSDRDRTARQRKVLLSIASKVKSQNPIQLSLLAERILPLITTDMSKMEILSQLANANNYLNGNIEQYVIPQHSSKLQLIDNYEVLTVDWKSEVKHLHELVYGGVEPKYYAK